MSSNPPSISNGVQSDLGVIGLLPTAGKATRIAPLPGSKELYPVGFQQGRAENNQADLLRPKVISHYLLERLRLMVGERRNVTPKCPKVRY